MNSIHTGQIQLCLVWLNDTRTLYSADRSGIIYVWDVKAKEGRRFSSGDGRHVDNGGGVIGDAVPPSSPSSSTSRHQHRYRRHATPCESRQDSVTTLLRLSGLDILASASMDGSIALWDITTGKQKLLLTGHGKGAP